EAPRRRGIHGGASRSVITDRRPLQSHGKVGALAGLLAIAVIRHAALLLIGLAAASPAAALDLTLLHTYDGQVLDGEYGFACAVIGDMDGDGFAELAIGANADSTGGRSAGRGFIFRRGGSHPRGPPARVAPGAPGGALGLPPP